jgi:hypothetical protein
MKRITMPNRLVQPTHFEDFDGHQFERLVFAYLLRTDNWQSLEWYGQTGGDSGRDIWGIKERDGYPQGQKVCVQCANRKALTYKKAREDLEKVLSRPNGKPDAFLIVAGGTVSAAVRDKTKKLCEKKQVNTSEIWSGKEFEERLRAKAESLLKRFTAGEEFPDAPDDLRSFAETIASQSDDEILALMAGLFDRPAFYTPFHQESSVPAFKKAITDTIEALNTGIHRLRDGTEIRRIPSRHALKSAETKRTLAQIERMLGELRAKYDDYMRTGDIRPCGCDVLDCPVFFISHHAADEMNRLREEVLVTFHKLYEAFDVKLGWKQWG